MGAPDLDQPGRAITRVELVRVSRIETPHHRSPSVAQLARVRRLQSSAPAGTGGRAAGPDTERGWLAVTGTPDGMAVPRSLIGSGVLDLEDLRRALAEAVSAEQAYD